jgi:DNA modification methylase
MDTRRAKLSDLTPDEKNANRGSERGSKMIEDSFRECGAGRSIVLDKHGRIIAGNKSFEAAGSIGMEDVVIVQTRGDQLVAVQRMDLDLATDKQAKNLALFDNRSGQVSLDWDIDALKGLGEEIDLEKFWTTDELAALLAVEILPAELQGDEDAVPEAPEDPVTKPGDIYKLGNHRLMCGDSTSITDVELLMAGEKAGMVFTDPPYGMGYRSNFREATEKFRPIENDDRILDICPILYAFMADDSAAYVCTRWDVFSEWYTQAITASLDVKNVVVWYKRGGGLGDLKNAYSPNHEFIIVAHKGTAPLRAKREADVWEIKRDSVNEYDHPTQKPVELAEFAISNHSSRGQVVLDLFGGSGSTLIACEKTGRKARIMELDGKYCDVIVARWEAATGKKAVLTNGETTQEN